jgi:hypothetical protein
MTDPSKESQVKQIHAWLMSGMEITPLEALNLFGCLRLSARIKDLENKGHVIKREMITVGKKRVAKYWIPRETII